MRATRRGRRRGSRPRGYNPPPWPESESSWRCATARTGLAPGAAAAPRGADPRRPLRREDEAHPFCVEERELRRALTGAGGLHAILDVVLDGQKTRTRRSSRTTSRTRSAAGSRTSTCTRCGSTSRSRRPSRRARRRAGGRRRRAACSRRSRARSTSRRCRWRCPSASTLDVCEMAHRRHAPPRRPPVPRGRHGPRRSRGDRHRDRHAPDPRRGARGGGRGGRGARRGRGAPRAAAEGEAPEAEAGRATKATPEA